MVTVIYSARDCVQLTMRGHAGAGPKGQDLVCAACSILAYAFAQTALDLWQEGALQEEPELDMAPGDSEIDMLPRDKRAQEAVRGILSGYRLLAKNWPECVRFLCAEGGFHPNGEGGTLGT